MVGQEWFVIPGLSKYEITNAGRVRNRKTKKELKLTLNGGYYDVEVISDTGTRKHHAVHRLVARTFLPAVPGKDYVNHKDGNRINNHVTNLEYVTLGENTRHAISTGLKNDAVNGRCRRPIIGTNVTTSVETWYPSAPMAAKALGLTEGGKSILGAVKYPHRVIGGCRWRQADLLILPDETWLPVAKCDDVILSYIAYEVSTLGRVRKIGSSSCLSTEKAESGYLVVRLCIAKGKTKPFRLHRLVATVFIPNPGNHPEVDHIDGDRAHNKVVNLQWLSKVDHAIKTCGKAVVQLDEHGNIINSYPTVLAAAQSIRAHPSHFGEKQVRRTPFVNGVAGYYLKSALTGNHASLTPSDTIAVTGTNICAPSGPSHQVSNNEMDAYIASLLSEGEVCPATPINDGSFLNEMEAYIELLLSGA